MSQEDKVLKRLKETGYVDNVWCVKNGILRLSSIVHRLFQYELVRTFGRNITNYTPKEKIRNKMNYHYILKKRCIENKDGTVTLKS